jgi:stage II sporulation protein E
MDICAIDLSSGEASFYKYGASASFIRTGQGAEVIETEERGTDTLSSSHYKPAKMVSGDFAIMVSDGVLEAFTEEGESSGL